MRVFLLPLLSLLPCVIGSDAPAPTPMPYMVDQGGHGLYVDDTLGFSASRLVSYGVKQAVVSNSIDCSVTLAAVPGGPWYDASGLSYVKGSVAAAKQQLAIAHNAGLKFFMATGT